ncbi:MAG TPA: GspH/FimT family pseudopilin [Candidatus Sulfotelmatobacter sp.]|nr:GspH/FimT family pseudopilin [Candidatus Sulfotelmatobacter sp.]
MKARRDSGFSLTELVVAMAVAMILMAVAMPYFLRAYHFYQLSNAATQMADILRLTRYEAIRQNRPVICVIQPDSSDPTMTDAFMTDTSGNRMTGVNARTILLGSAGNLVSAGSVPGAGALPTAAQLVGTTPVSVPPSGGTVRFDARGAVSTGNVNAFYLNSSVAPEAGYRVVLLMPAGSLEIWTGDSTGNWQQLR